MDALHPSFDTDRDNDGSVAGGGGHSAALDGDVLGEEFPDDRPWASRDYGTTEAEQARREPLDRRLRREQPDGLADDQQALREPEDDESPDLLSVFDDDGGNTEKEMATIRARRDRHPDDSGQFDTSRGPEEDAVYIIDQESALDDN